MNAQLSALPPVNVEIAREIAPRAHRVWMHAQENEVTKLLDEFNHWLSGITLNEKLFETNVYSAPDVSEMDLRQHRARLYALLAHGEDLWVKFNVMSDHIDPQNYLNLIDERLAQLRDIFYQWHGDLADRNDVPESLKQAFLEVDAGELLDLDAVLSESAAQ